MKKRHDCANCDFMKSLKDNSGRIISFCMFDLSPGYLGVVGVCSRCELDKFVEEMYENTTNK